MINSGWTYREQVDAAAAGCTVLDYYSDRYTHSSRDDWGDRILTEAILLDGNPTTSDTPLKRGQWLTYQRPPWEEPEVPLDIQILAEDPELLVVVKPSGLPVLPGGGFLENTLLRQLQRRYPQSPPLPVHRLGRGTSGLMLLARSPAARASLSQQLRDRQMHKIYWAIAQGVPTDDVFTLTYPIGKLAYPRLGYLHAATPDGVFAHSDCRVLRRFEETSLWEVSILTGRPHQIRIHLAAAGYPLWQDPLYGVGGVPKVVSNSASDQMAMPGDCGYYLHAKQLTFVHPVNGVPMRFDCPLPLAWHTVVDLT